MERWRLFVALGAALGALPLLAIDNVSSAEGRDETPRLEVLGTIEHRDGALDLLAARSSSWAAAREETRILKVNEALSLEAQANAEQAARAAEEARLAEAEAAKQMEATKKAEAARKAELARQAAAAAAKKAAATTTTAKPAPKPTAAPSSGEPTAEQWHKLRQCESGNNYAALSAGGRFRGAYQFSQATWNWVAAQVAPQLVDVDPAEAAPGDQDNMALNLYRMRGAGQWPVCGKALA